MSYCIIIYILIGQNDVLIEQTIYLLFNIWYLDIQNSCHSILINKINK